MSNFAITKAMNDEEIREILFAEDVKDYLILSKVDREQDVQLMNRGITFYILKYKGKNVGIAAFLPKESGYHGVDIGFLPSFRGKIGLILGKMLIKQYFIENECKGLGADIEKTNRRSYYYAMMCGMKKFNESNDRYCMRIENND